MRVSDDAAGRQGKCKDCGKTVTIPVTSRQTAKTEPAAENAPESVLYTASPAMFRNRPVLFCLYVLLACAGLLHWVWFLIAGTLLFLWWFINKGSTLIVTNKRTTMRRGIFSKRISEIMHRDVRNVQIDQSFLQRIFGVGRVGISSAAQASVEIELTGLPHPYRIKTIVDQNR